MEGQTYVKREIKLFERNIIDIKNTNDKIINRNIYKFYKGLNI